MTIIMPENPQFQSVLHTEQVACIDHKTALQQDIRPMRIGILNIMPFGEKYEFNLLHPLGISLIQVDPIWIRLQSHSYKTSDRNHIQDLYVTYEEAIQDSDLDGLIVTGAPIEHLPFEEVKYWEEIREILLDAKTKYPSTLGICWGALALGYLEGIEKLDYRQKLFGVFEIQNLAPEHPIMGAMDDVFLCPQSRVAGNADKIMEDAAAGGVINLLGYGDEAGYVIYETPDQRFLMHVGHPEYNSQRLVYEAIRDQGRPEVPPPRNFDADHPANSWRSHRNTFFTQWLKYCYTCISMNC